MNKPSPAMYLLKSFFHNLLPHLVLSNSSQLLANCQLFQTSLLAFFPASSIYTSIAMTVMHVAD